MALEHASSGAVVDLMQAPPPEKTAALVKTDRFEAVRLYVPAGGEIPPHQVRGFVTLQCLQGHVVLGLDREVDLRSGEWIYLDRSARHSVRAVDDSYLLLTILFDS